jgi:cytochrome bd ubiquinol oxidase subunit II
MGAPFGLPELLALVMLAALVAYALMGGADFGGGLWDLLAFGPRAADQRRLIEQALAPVWEANHVWLIFVIVILFSAFPPAFAVLAIALHVPLTLMLVGIVLRGSAFVFRQYGAGSVPQVRLWGRVFAIASVVAPFFLGTVLAAITEGVPVLPHFGRAAEGAQLLVAGVSWQWTSPFALVVGGFTLALFGYLAAVYLTLESPDPHLAEAFRWRALIAGVVVGELAFTSLFMARSQAPLFYARLLRSWWSWPLQITTGALAIGALYLLWRRRYRLARVLAVAQAALIVIGWGLAQHPNLIAPDLTIRSAAAPPAALRVLVPALVVGGAILLPSLYYLMRIFKRPAVSADPPSPPGHG